MSEVKTFEIQNKPLMCQHCGFDRFNLRSGQVNTAALSFFNLDWLNTSADVYVCGHCGFMHWFLPRSYLRDADALDAATFPPEPLPDDDTSTPSACLSCGASIPVGVDACSKCGWSYRTPDDAD